MRPPVPRFVRWAVALAVIVALTTAVFQYRGSGQYGTAHVHSIAQDTGWTPTQWGPLGPADRDLLVMVRQAGLCGGSSGRAAQRQASSAQVRTAAVRTGVDYGELDGQVRAVAGKLGVRLPDQPTAQQQSWLRELSAQSGPDFDRMFAQRLRGADGAMLPVITRVRADTRNELIRSFAATASVVVNRDMEGLEGTGLIDYSRLSEPAPPAAAVTSVVNATPAPLAGPASGPASSSDMGAMTAAVVLIAALLVVLGLLGASGRRVERAGGPAHRGIPRRRRHAAQRW